MKHVTKTSLRNFFKLALSIGQPTYWYHQTLTYPEKVWSLKEAKAPLNTFLKRLLKRFKVFVLYAIEEHRDQGLHVHMLICFYGDTFPFPPSHVDRFGSEAFKIWNNIHGGRCARQANMTTRPQIINPTYFIKDVRSIPRGAQKEREGANWFGYRNINLLKAHGVPVDESQLRELMASYSCSPRRWKALSSRKYELKQFSTEELSLDRFEHVQLLDSEAEESVCYFEQFIQSYDTEGDRLAA